MASFKLESWNLFMFAFLTDDIITIDATPIFDIPVLLKNVPAHASHIPFLDLHKAEYLILTSLSKYLLAISGVNSTNLPLSTILEKYQSLILFFVSNTFIVSLEPQSLPLDNILRCCVEYVNNFSV